MLLWPMPPRKPTARTAPRVGRYSLRKATLEVELAIGRTNRSQKEVAAAAGISEPQFSKKLYLVNSSFTIEELGLIADFFDAPPGWPFVAWEFGRKH